MTTWIFKLIWIPALSIIWACGFAVVLLILKDVGWTVPFRWLTIIGVLAFVADRLVNE